jgi:hypothetical protein
MPEAFSFNREFDFVRLDGLQRAAGRPAHEWDLYIVKELVDNALDADETLWRDDPAHFPRVDIRMEYIPIPERQAQQLYIQVGNRAMFPVAQIEDIFATGWYTSRKAFMKGLTRGSLGNALKTLLGIPYVLRNRVASDWKPDLKPMAIICGGKEFLPRYEVNSTTQTIQFKCDSSDVRFPEGTIFRVGLDHFEQEMPRTLAQVALLAQQYRLCNPHAEFTWSVEIGGEEWQVQHAPVAGWSGKFLGVAPIQWYSHTAFQDLLGALYRKQFGERPEGLLPVEAICRCFAGFDVTASTDRATRKCIDAIAESCGRTGLTRSEIETQAASRLYRALCDHSARFDSNLLGRLGADHVRGMIRDAFPTEGEILYEVATDPGNDPDTPFVIEVVAARLKDNDQDGQRQIWTAINFAPTYGDPFLSRWLRAPVQPDKPVLGLRGLLDAYDVRDNSPVALFLHLVCPTIEHSEFSKTEINHLPFKQILGEVLDKLLTGLKRSREEEELRLEQAVFKVLDAIMGELKEDERFVFDQLLERLRARLSQDAALANWLERPEAVGRLQAYIASYQTRNTVLSQHVARPAAATVSLPLHPDRHVSVLVEHFSADLAAHYHVNKLLYLQARELEPVVIENGWLCRMDMALIRTPSGLDELRQALVQCAAASPLPILVLHNADEQGQAAVDQARRWLEERHLSNAVVVDVGLGTTEDNVGTAPRRLVEMMSGELVAWLLARLQALRIPVKAIPGDSDIRRDVRQKFELLLLGHLWEGVSQEIGVTRLLVDLDRHVQFTGAMMQQALDEQLKQSLQVEECNKSYAAALDDAVGQFYQDFMSLHGTQIHSLMQAHLTAMKSGRGR